MESRSEAGMMCLLGVAKKHGKLYCYPSQKTIVRLLDEYHGFEISRRALNRDLIELEREGFIRRTRRLTAKGIRAGCFSSTLYRFGRRAFKYLGGLVKWAEGVLSFSRVPKVAHNRSEGRNEISLKGFGACGNGVDKWVEGGASRIAG